jgi:hypothetical protein
MIIIAGLVHRSALTVWVRTIKAITRPRRYCLRSLTTVLTVRGTPQNHCGERQHARDRQGRGNAPQDLHSHLVNLSFVCFPYFRLAFPFKPRTLLRQ